MGVSRALERFVVGYPFMDEDIGYEVTELESGEAAIEELNNTKPDIVLLDNKLPKMDGIEVLEYINQLQWDIEVMMITSFASLELAVKATNMGAYDFETGEEIWKMSGGGDAPSTTPVVADGLIYINNAHGRYSPIYVVKPEAKGDITLSEGETSNEFIVWNIMRGGAYMQTPLIYKGLYYNLRGNGMLSCMNAKTGEEYYRENLRPMTGMTSSCIASDDKIYCISEKGDVFVIQAGKEFKLLGGKGRITKRVDFGIISDGIKKRGRK